MQIVSTDPRDLQTRQSDPWFSLIKNTEMYKFLTIFTILLLTCDSYTIYLF